MTGFRDVNLENLIKEKRGELTTSVSKHTYKVIVKSLDEDSGKADKGRELGILITKKDFVDTYFN